MKLTENELLNEIKETDGNVMNALNEPKRGDDVMYKYFTRVGQEMANNIQIKKWKDKEIKYQYEKE